MDSGSIAATASRTVNQKNSYFLRYTPRSQQEVSLRMVGDAQGDYYGEASGSYMVKELSLIEELEQIVQLASQPIPERPDGIVVVVKYSSASRAECRATEAEYERFARNNPATIFMRCMEEFEDAHLLLEQVNVRCWPTTDIFYQGNRVARIEGPDLGELEKALPMYQFMNSDLDLFSEDASKKRELQWGDGKAKDMTKTPRTTNRFVPAYDFDSDKGFFDAQADKAQESFEDTFGNWLPNIDDDDDDDDDDETGKGKN
eukprot:jgi/Psemu1/62955/estExt_Genemark1.C_130046